MILTHGVNSISSGSPILYSLCNNCINNKDIPLFGQESETLINYEFLNPGYKFSFPSPTINTIWSNLSVSKFHHAEIEIMFGGNFNYTFWIQFLFDFRIMHADGGNMTVPNKNVLRFAGITDISSNTTIIHENDSVKYVILGNGSLERYSIKFDYDGEYLLISFGQNYSYWVRFKTNISTGDIITRLLSGSGSDIYLYKLIFQ